MTTQVRLFAAGISMFFFFGCATTQQPVVDVRTETATPAFAAAPQLVPLPMYAESVEYSKLEMRPGEALRTEAGRIDWSPKMRATLTGGDDFDIIPTAASS